MATSDRAARAGEYPTQHPHPCKWVLQMHLVNPAPQPYIRFCNRLRLIVGRGPRERQDVALPNDWQCVGSIDHRLALSNPALVSAPSQQSCSSVSCPFVACSTFSLRSFAHLSILCAFVTLVCIGCDSSSPEAKKAKHRERAASYLERGQYQKAIIEYRNVAKIDSKDADAHYRLALAYLKLGGVPNLQQAFAEISRTVGLDKTNQNAQLKLGKHGFDELIANPRPLTSFSCFDTTRHGLPPSFS